MLLMVPNGGVTVKTPGPRCWARRKEQEITEITEEQEGPGDGCVAPPFPPLPPVFIRCGERVGSNNSTDVYSFSIQSSNI
jgi:hypothetical protein